MQTYGRLGDDLPARTGVSESQPLQRICDRGDCPAPAARELSLAGQDFYFCNHHAAELEPVAAASQSLEAEEVGALDPAVVS